MGSHPFAIIIGWPLIRVRLLANSRLFGSSLIDRLDVRKTYLANKVISLGVVTYRSFIVSR